MIGQKVELHTVSLVLEIYEKPSKHNKARNIPTGRGAKQHAAVKIAKMHV